MSDHQPVSALHARLERLFVSRGLTPSPVQDGVSYKLGRATVLRIDPKPQAGFLRVHVGPEAERYAPRDLVGQYIQKGWLKVTEENADLAQTFLASFLDRTLAERG